MDWKNSITKKNAETNRYDVVLGDGSMVLQPFSSKAHWELEANAKLIADAFNTFNECGHVPSDLLAKLEHRESTIMDLKFEREDLLEKYKEAVKAVKKLTNHIQGSGNMLEFEDMIEMEEIIQKQTS